MKKNSSKKLTMKQKRMLMKQKRMLDTEKIERKWSEDTSKGSAGFVEYYKPKGIRPKHNPKPLQGGSPGLGKKK